ncbi:MAG: hypothetical protein IPK13_03555 [Deltaproteobacteria bacterium]|nr:hypothetical protein [Deltaproteobacteria bacterium]
MVAVATTPASAAALRLEQAMDAVREAIATLEQDAPGSEAFDRADAAIAELSTRTEAGVDLEPKDLDYAKTALRARRMLREKRAYIDQKRAKTEIFAVWRELKQELTDLESTVERATRSVDRAAGAEATEATEDARASEAHARLEKIKARLSESKVRRGGEADEAFGTFLRQAGAAVDELIRKLAQHRTALEIQRARAKIDAQMTKLHEVVRAMHEAKPTDETFGRADAALRDVEATIKDAGALAAKDAGFARDVAATRQEVERIQKEVSATFSAAGLARLKEELEPAHRALKQIATGFSGKSSGPKGAANEPVPNQQENERENEELAEARTAAIVVRKQLERFQGLIARSDAVKKYAHDVRETLIEVETRLQARALVPIEEAMDRAMSALSARSPTEEAVAEAEGLIDSLRPVLSLGETLERESRAYAQRAQQARKKAEAITKKISSARMASLVATQAKALDKARRDLLTAIDALKRRDPSDEQFKEARTAQIVLEKTLERLASDREIEAAFRRDKTTAILRRDSATLARNASREIDRRMREVQAERQRGLIEPSLKFIAKALEKVGRQPLVDEATLDAIEAKLIEARAALAAGETFERQVFDYRKWARDAKRTLLAHERDLSKRRFALALSLNRSVLDDGLAAARDAIAKSLALEATKTEVDELAENLEAVRRSFAEGMKLAESDRTHRAYLTRVQQTFEAMAPKLDLARALLTLREKMSRAAFGAETSLEKAASAASLAEQKRLLDSAIEDLETCQEVGTSSLDSTPEVGTAMLVWRAPDDSSTQTLNTKAFVARCSERLGTTKETLKQVTGLLAFERGPKRTSEAARERLSRASSASGADAKALSQEALSLFEECISSGKILEYSNPELKDRTFEVSGRPVTLSALVKACTAESKRLRNAQP